MNTETRHIHVHGIAIEVVRKGIKNLHLGVYPPHGRVRVAAPLGMSDEAIRMAIVTRLAWINKQRAKFAEQPRQSEREAVTGESHYYLGRRYRLRVHEQAGPSRLELSGNTRMDLYVRPGLDASAREAIILRWYRDQLRELLPPLLAKWEEELGVKASRWGIKRMKTRWGSCNPATGSVWFNLELAKKPSQCLEYLVVHELLHLIDRTHGDRFKVLLDQHLPQWRLVRSELNRAPLGHVDWEL